MVCLRCTGLFVAFPILTTLAFADVFSRTTWSKHSTLHRARSRGAGGVCVPAPCRGSVNPQGGFAPKGLLWSRRAALGGSFRRGWRWETNQGNELCLRKFCNSKVIGKIVSQTMTRPPHTETIPRFADPATLIRS